MGQTNSSIISKLGYSMHWNSMWDDKFNFTKKLKEDIFLNMFLPLFFKKIFLNLTHLQHLMKETTKKKSKQRITLFFLFFGKSWILRYQNWIIIIFYIYNPKLSLKKKINKNKLQSKKDFFFLIQQKFLKKFNICKNNFYFQLIK